MNDHAPKMDCAKKIINICPRKVVLKSKNYQVSLFGLVFVGLPLLIPQNNIIKILLLQFLSAMGPCLFPTKAPFLPHHRKTHWTMLVNNVDLKICLLGTSNSMATQTIFSLGVN
jgi:hypothetical protein